MEEKPTRSKGRPPKAVVTRDKISSAALEIAEKNGYEQLTMTRIAKHMGVAPSALYYHVKDKEALLALVQDRVVGRVDVTALDAAIAGERRAVDALEEWAWSYRNVFSEHLPLIRFIATAPVGDSPQTVAMYERVVHVIAAAGVPEEAVIAKLVALEAFIFGSAYDVHAPATIYAVSDADSAPHLSRLAAAFTARLDKAQGSPHANSSGGERILSPRNPRADLPFARGLATLLDNLVTP